MGRRICAREQPGQSWAGGRGGESSRHARSLGRDADDADTTWALHEDGSVFSSQQLMRFPAWLSNR